MNQRKYLSMRTKWVKASSVLLGILLVITTTHGEEQRTVSLGDCSFSARPDDFLAGESRVRNQVSATALKLGPNLPRRNSSDPLAASSIPRRNFIDDFIFGAMAAQNVASARLTTDAEFFRRINLDLIGRIPGPDEVRSFVADTTPNKRD